MCVNRQSYFGNVDGVSSAKASMTARVLIVSGTLGLASGARGFVAKGLPVFRRSKGPWFAIHSMLESLEVPLLAALERRTLHFTRAPYRRAVESFLAARERFDVPDLAEVSLATALTRAGVPFEAASFTELYADPARRRRLLEQCKVVFLSTTYVKNRMELESLARLFKREDNKLVAGGAFVSLVHDRWTPLREVDVVAIGYGELLVPALAEWLEGGCRRLAPPPGGRVVESGSNLLLYSGLPSSKSLDDLDAPDWSIAKRYHGRQFPLAHYESVRGCPYRCGFCNYPFLFADTKFRMRSAERIARDWQELAAVGVRTVNCLDSLFTMPRQRLVKLCQLLIERHIELRWTCYARADDLAEPGICELMRRAGCVLVSMGVESGSQQVLDNMDKRCTVEQNALGIRNARAAGISVNATIIVGFPGDTFEGVVQTLEFLRVNPPDFVAVQPFGVGSERMPVLSPENRARFELTTAFDGWLWHSCWRHRTMSSPEAVELSSWLKLRLMKERIALDASVFYDVGEWDRSLRGALLDYQRDFAARHRLVRGAWSLARAWAKRNSTRDIARMLGPRVPAVGR
jgi:anaerobic magnesium-protoporphyrin IX monomethyl ester cyclase